LIFNKRRPHNQNHTPLGVIFRVAGTNLPQLFSVWNVFRIAQEIRTLRANV